MTTPAKPIDLSGVEETALLTLYARVIESQSEDPIFKDEIMEAMVAQLDHRMQNQDSQKAEQLKNRGIAVAQTLMNNFH